MRRDYSGVALEINAGKHSQQGLSLGRESQTKNERKYWWLQLDEKNAKFLI